MRNKLKIDAATTSFGSCADRFVRKGYKKQHSFEKQLEIDAAIESKGADVARP